MIKTYTLEQAVLNTLQGPKRLFTKVHSDNGIDWYSDRRSKSVEIKSRRKIKNGIRLYLENGKVISVTVNIDK